MYFFLNVSAARVWALELYGLVALSELMGYTFLSFFVNVDK